MVSPLFLRAGSFEWTELYKPEGFHNLCFIICECKHHKVFFAAPPLFMSLNGTEKSKERDSRKKAITRCTFGSKHPPKKQKVLLTHELQAGEAFPHSKHRTLHGHFSHRPQALLAQLWSYRMGFLVLFNITSCPSSSVRALWSPCSPTTSWAHRKRIALGHWDFPTPSPSRKWARNQCQASSVGVALTLQPGDWLFCELGQWLTWNFFSSKFFVNCSYVCST